LVLDPGASIPLKIGEIIRVCRFALCEKLLAESLAESLLLHERIYPKGLPQSPKGTQSRGKEKGSG
jgi:hypothetical protein